MQNLLLSLMCSKLSAKSRGEVEPAVMKLNGQEHQLLGCKLCKSRHNAWAV